MLLEETIHIYSDNPSPTFTRLRSPTFKALNSDQALKSSIIRSQWLRDNVDIIFFKIIHSSGKSNVSLKGQMCWNY